MSSAEAARRRRQILAEIARLGSCLPGSLVERISRCGNPRCACHTDERRRHGPYPSWTRKVAGKTVTKSLSAEQVETYRPWFDNAQRLHELVRELEQLSVEVMAEQQGWPPPPEVPPDRRRARGAQSGGSPPPAVGNRRDERGTGTSG